MSFEAHPINQLYRAGPPQFVTTDAKTLLAKAVAKVETDTGRKISPSQVESFVLDAVAYMLSVRGEEEQQAIARQYLAYQDGKDLDNFGVSCERPRLKASAATANVTFSAVAGHSRIQIPAGTRVGDSAGQVQFATAAAAWVEVGQASVTVQAVAVELGVGANGFAVGALDSLVDPIAGISSVSNVTASAGGAAAESDDHYRGRLAMRFERLGDGVPRERYVIDVFDWSARCVAVHVGRPSAGCVSISPLMDTGAPTASELAQLQSFFDKSFLHQGDDVTVGAPASHDFSFTLILRVKSSDAVAPAEEAVRGVLAAWAKSLGGYIAPSELTSAAKAVQNIVDANVTGLIAAPVAETAWRRCTGFTTTVQVV